MLMFGGTSPPPPKPIPGVGGLPQADLFGGGGRLDLDAIFSGDGPGELRAGQIVQDGAVSRKYVKLAERYGLVTTGGSDFHGSQFGANRWLGRPRVEPAVYEELQAFYSSMRANEAGN